jgi:hypothetical protein
MQYVIILGPNIMTTTLFCSHITSKENSELESDTHYSLFYMNSVRPLINLSLIKDHLLPLVVRILQLFPFLANHYNHSSY